MDPSTILSTLLWGVAIGCIYILLATGLNIIFGVMKLVNFAHGQLLMVGAFIAYSVTVTTGLNAYIAILVSMVTVAALGIIVERYTFRKVLGTDKLNEIFISLGLIYVFENAAMLIWGYKNQQIVTPFNRLTLDFYGLSIPYDLIAALIIAVAMLGSITFIIQKTKIGLAMRATSQKREPAMLMGINIDKIYLITFAIGAALAGVAGALFGIIYPFSYKSGSMPTIKAFSIIILGGLGSIKGAIVGGLLYGITEQFAVLFLGGIWGNAIAFVLLIVVLVIRPTGLFGEKGE